MREVIEKKDSGYLKRGSELQVRATSNDVHSGASEPLSVRAGLWFVKQQIFHWLIWKYSFWSGNFWELSRRKL